MPCRTIRRNHRLLLLCSVRKNYIEHPLWRWYQQTIREILATTGNKLRRINKTLGVSQDIPNQTISWEYPRLGLLPVLIQPTPLTNFVAGAHMYGRSTPQHRIIFSIALLVNLPTRQLPRSTVWSQGVWFLCEKYHVESDISAWIQSTMLFRQRHRQPCYSHHMSTVQHWKPC